MKKSIYILLIISMSLFSCASQKKLQTKTPFDIGNASCQEWSGGREESGKGTILKIPVSHLPAGGVAMQQVFFRGKIADITMESHEGNIMAIAKFKRPSLEKPDIIMHADPKMEVGNQPPKMEKREKMDFPFELENSEAVISYLENGKLRYTKITGIKDKAPLIYNSKPRG